LSHYVTYRGGDVIGTRRIADGALGAGEQRVGASLVTIRYTRSDAVPCCPTPSVSEPIYHV
jgi:hypothetical protein